MIRAYLHLLNRIKQAGVVTLKHVMDNNVSEVLREVIEKDCTLDLVPPGCHRRNAAEVAIKTFKAHFIAILTGLPTSFPINVHPMQDPHSLPTPTSLAKLISTRTHWPQLEVRYSAMSSQEIEAHGQSTPKTDDSWAVSCPTTELFAAT